mmetsp:Transcript_22047/g.70393  ORF Transcript_22047/g.70393 Transcript_22047/m.70393 type:complete len:227 (+) Transcript_22047:2484-3164(+)
MHLRAHRRVQGRLCARVPDAIDAVGGDGVLRGRLDPRRDAQGGARLRRAVRRRHLPRRPARARVHARRAQGDPPRHQGGQRAARLRRHRQACRPRHCCAAAAYHVEARHDDRHAALDGAGDALAVGARRRQVRHQGGHLGRRHHRHRARADVAALLKHQGRLPGDDADSQRRATLRRQPRGGVGRLPRFPRRRPRQGAGGPPLRANTARRPLPARRVDRLAPRGYR